MENLWQPDLENGDFKNPVIFADYSDPDIIRVKDTYYMTASSFNYVPGLPILISKDLVNWELVNYAIRQINYERYDIPRHAQGVWAPAIRYHEERFYIYYGMPDEGIFVVTTRDPLGEWEEPQLVLEGKGLIDPCPFWDENGKAYVIHGYAKSRIGFKSCLGIFPMSYDGTKATGEDHILYNGVSTQPTIEGPKTYKRNGYYYIFAPAGGVKTGWQTVLRGKSIYGPFEEKIVMQQGNSIINGPHQGGLTDTVNGEEWFLHFQDRGLYGRIVHMQPVVWENDWPVIGILPKNGCGEPCLVHKKPDTKKTEKPLSLQASDEFEEEKLSLIWQWLGNSKDNFYSLSERKGFLRLYCLNPSKKSEPILWENANVLTQKLVCPYFKATVCLHFSALSENEQAGMVMMGGDYAYIGVRMARGKKILVLGKSEELPEGIKEKVEQLEELPSAIQKVWISFTMEEGEDGPVFSMYYSLDGKEEINAKAEFMPSDHTWVGAKIGLFATVLEQKNKGGYADFEYIRVTSLNRNEG